MAQAQDVPLPVRHLATLRSKCIKGTHSEPTARVQLPPFYCCCAEITAGSLMLLLLPHLLLLLLLHLPLPLPVPVPALLPLPLLLSLPPLVPTLPPTLMDVT